MCALFPQISFEEHEEIIYTFGGNLFNDMALKDTSDIQIVPWGCPNTFDELTAPQREALIKAYRYGDIYSMDLIIRAIQLGRMPDREEWTTYRVLRHVPPDT